MSLHPVGSVSLENSYYKIIYLFGLHWVFVAVWAFLELWLAGATVQLQHAGFSLLVLCWSTGSRRAGFSSCGARARQLQFWAPEQRLKGCGTRV